MVLSPKAKKSTRLNGSSQYWTKAAATGMDFDSTVDFTVSFWIKRNGNFPSNQRIVDKWSGVAGFYVIVSTSAIQALIQDASSAKFATYSSASNIGNGLFHNVTVTFRRSLTTTIYYDGDSVASSASISPLKSINNSTRLTIGGDRNGSNLSDAYIGEVQVISGYALTASEVKSLTSAKASYGGGSVVAWYQWNGGLDKSGSGNHLTPVSSPLIVNVRY